MSQVEPEKFLARTKSFTRRSGRMPESLERTWVNSGPQYLIQVQRDGGHTTVAADQELDLTQIFGREAPLVIEIGSGAGDQIVHAAAANPERNHLAFEVWTPGLAKTVSQAVAKEVTNLRLLEADAAQALDRLLPPAVAAEVWTFFPDPWRKARHHKRRLVSPAFADTVARVLQPGGIWRLATDWSDYAWQMLEVVEGHSEFENLHPQFAPRWPGRVKTRFEARGERDGRDIFDLEVRRK